MPERDTPRMPKQMKLSITQGPHAGRRHAVDAGVSLVIGRDPGCDVPIADPTLSRRHFVLEADGERVILRDLDSTNGTAVNGQTVHQTTVEPGDVITAGESSFAVEMVEPSAHIPAEPATRRRLAVDNGPSAAAGESPATDTATPVPPGAPAEPPPAGEAAPSRGVASLTVRVVAGSHRGRSWQVVPGPPVVLGSDAECTLAIADPRLATRHLTLEWDGRRAVVRDLGAPAGTRLNGRPVQGAELADRDEIAIGETVLLIRLPAPLAADDTPPAPAPVDEPLENAERPCTVFKVLAGARLGELLVAPPVARVTVGRAADCQVVIDEPEISQHHAELAWEGDRWVLRDLDSANGTRLNGRRVTTPVGLEDRDEVALGGCTLLVRLPAVPPPPEPTPVFPLPVFDAFAGTPPPPIRPPGTGDPLLGALRSALAETEPLGHYALIDGAQAVELAVIARQLGHRVFSLFSGAAASSLAHVGPCLVDLDQPSPFVDHWRAAMGRNAGVLLAAEGDLDRVSAHLREIFVVTDESDQEFFFRYYDPRVLRAFLPTCTADELREFFGPVRWWIAEDETGAACLAFSVERRALRRDRLGAPAVTAAPTPPG